MIIKLLGLVILLGSLGVVYFFESASGQQGWLRIFHWPAIILTGLGPFGLVFLCSDWSLLKDSLKVLFQLSPANLRKQRLDQLRILQDLSQKYYVQGVRAFSSHAAVSSASHQVSRVIERLSAKVPVPDVIQLVERERDRMVTFHKRALSMVGLGLRLSPSIGMLGTILGMVQLLSHLSDPSNIGSHMSLALLTTFYGLFFSLTLWTPLMHRLESIVDLMDQNYDQILHWLELLEQRKPAQYFSEETGEFSKEHSQPASKSSDVAHAALTSQTSRSPA